MYKPRPDRLHRLAFPANAELVNEWCEHQYLAGGFRSTHSIPQDMLLMPRETIELHPKMVHNREVLTDGTRLHEIVPAIAAANGRDRVITWDTYHVRRGPWRRRGPWMQKIAPFVGCVHLQPDRDEPIDFHNDCLGGKSNALLSLRQLYWQLGVQAPIIVEVSPFILSHLYGWRTLLSPTKMCDHILRYADQARLQLG